MSHRVIDVDPQERAHQIVEQVVAERDAHRTELGDPARAEPRSRGRASATAAAHSARENGASQDTYLFERDRADGLGAASASSSAHPSPGAASRPDAAPTGSSTAREPDLRKASVAGARTRDTVRHTWDSVSRRVLGHEVFRWIAVGAFGAALFAVLLMLTVKQLSGLLSF